MSKKQEPEYEVIWGRATSPKGVPYFEIEVEIDEDVISIRKFPKNTYFAHCQLDLESDYIGDGDARAGWGTTTIGHKIPNDLLTPEILMRYYRKAFHVEISRKLADEIMRVYKEEPDDLT